MTTVIAFVSQKGGSGKTTLAVAVAVAAARAEDQVEVIDLDPQGSALTWGRCRGDEAPEVAARHPPRLRQGIESARAAGADVVVIDTGPREGGGAAEAARLADLVLIPCRPAAVDLAAVPATLATVAGSEAVVVLNGCPPRGQWTPQATEALRSIGAKVCPVTLGYRVAHARSFMAGRTAQELEGRSVAAAEVTALHEWIRREGGA